MNDSSIFRVNVTSAASTPVFNTAGDRLAEIDMQLPQNLISTLKREEIQKAKMQVSKMKIPLLEIPATSINLRPLTPSSSDHRLTTTGLVFLHPMYKLGDKRYVFPNNLARGYLNTTEYLQPVYIKTLANHYYENPSAASVQELSKGFHEYKDMEQFLMDFSSAIEYCLFANARPTLETNLPPCFRWSVKSDNTIELDVQLHLSSYIPVPYYKGLFWGEDDFQYSHDMMHPLVSKSITTFEGNGDPNRAGGYDRFGIFVNEDVERILPTLPWKKISREVIGLSDRFPDFLYLLDTDEAQVKISQPGLTVESMDPDMIKSFANLNFKFNESDAISNSDVSSLILTMNGASFNQMVLPVNFRQGTNMAAAAQVTQFPAIELYYPLWGKPSDTSTELIISTENFSNAAPVDIHPSLLSERNLKFKLWYVTNKGELREMYIPTSSEIWLQLIFEITK